MMKFSKYFLVAFMSASLLPLCAIADDVSSNNLDSRNQTSPFSGGAEGNVNLSSGNTNVKTYGATAFTDYKGDVFTTRFKAGYMQNTTVNVEEERRIDGSLRTGFNVTNNLDLFGLATYMQNPFKGLGNQEMVTPGIGLYFVNTPDVTVRIEGAAGYMWESYYPSTLSANNFSVATGGSGMRYKFSDVADVTNDFLYIVPITTTSDYRMNDTVALTSAITKHMALKFAFTVEYRHIPVAAHVENDNFTTAALVFKL